jgi:hypothetical protein
MSRIFADNEHNLRWLRTDSQLIFNRISADYERNLFWRHESAACAQYLYYDQGDVIFRSDMMRIYSAQQQRRKLTRISAASLSRPLPQVSAVTAAAAIYSAQRRCRWSSISVAELQPTTSALHIASVPVKAFLRQACNFCANIFRLTLKLGCTHNFDPRRTGTGTGTVSLL